jgi:hypothetical protein
MLIEYAEKMINAGLAFVETIDAKEVSSFTLLSNI